MPSAVDRFCVFLLSIMLLLCTASSALADGLTFPESPNARRSYSQYLDEVKQHKANYVAARKAAGERFEASAERRIKRYVLAMDREVRTLTRAGEIDMATAVRAHADQTETWKITPPDEKGVHFLNQVNLEVKGSDKANKLGVDLLVQVEQAGVLYTKQDDLAFEQLIKQIDGSREALHQGLVRAKEIEQSAGRLDAVQEVMEGIKAVKALPPIEREASSDRPASQTVNDRSRPSYAGYYLLTYPDPRQPYDKFAIQLTEDGGVVHFVKKPDEEKLVYTLSQPIEILSVQPRGIVIRHEFITGGGHVVHAIALEDGKPSESRLWWNEDDFKNKVRPAGPAKVKSMGTPDADMLGLKDGFYRADIRYTRDSSGVPCDLVNPLEFQVTDGRIIMSRHATPKEVTPWTKYHLYMLDVETQGKSLILRYDSDAYSWIDIFEIDMSDPEGPVVKHWWKNYWHSREEAPSGAGLLKPHDPAAQPQIAQQDGPRQPIAAVGEDRNNRPKIFEGIHDEQLATTPKPLSKGGSVSWSGYHLLKYSINGRKGVEFLVKLDKTGGSLLMTSRQSKGNERVNHDIPIEIVRHSDSSVLFKHKSDMVDSTTIHHIELVNGQPRLCKAWWSTHAYAAKDDPSQTGQVFRMGNPDADLLGLADGVYLATLDQTKNKGNRPEVKRIQFEITVDAGHVMVSRHNKGTAKNGWSEWHAFMLVVKTDGNELIMTYDRDEFEWADLFVVDMSDKTRPVLKHWWRGDWRTRGDGPSAAGELVKQ